MTGWLAYSLAGHDKGSLYVIVKEEKDYLWLSDGNVRPLEKPKKKNKKHIQIIKKAGNLPLPVTNETIKRTIKLYNKDIQEVK